MRHVSHRVFVGALVLALFAVIAALAVAIASQQRASRDGLVERFEMRAHLAARFVDAYVRELAGHQRDVAAARLGAQHVRRSEFEQVVSARGYPAAVLLDPDGRLLQVAPRRPELLGRSMTPGYAHLREAGSSGRVAVSNVVPSAALGVPVTAIAVPYWTPYGRRVFSGAYDMTRTPLSAYLRNFHPVSSARAAIIDANDRLVASDGQGLPPGTATEDTVVAGIAVAGTPWRVRASVSRRELLAPVGGARIWLPCLVLAGFAVLGAVAIALAARQRRAMELLRRAHADVMHQATHDPLTGLWNRRRFEDELVRTVGRARRYGVPSALLVLDLDGFKAVNDTLGHHVGDELIKAVGAAIQGRVRATDGVARLGGDEFAVLLVHVDPQDASAIAEDVAEAVRRATVSAGNAIVGATASIGIAHIDRDSAAHQDVLVQADRAMYAAKAAGRDRVAPHIHV